MKWFQDIVLIHDDNYLQQTAEVEVWCFKVQSTIKNPSLRFQLAFKGKQRLGDRSGFNSDLHCDWPISRILV